MDIGMGGEMDGGMDGGMDGWRDREGFGRSIG